MTTETEQTQLDPQDGFYNTIREAKVAEITDDGVLYDIGADTHALVTKDEFIRTGIPEVGHVSTILVERPWGGFWAASVQKAEKLAMWDHIEGLVKSGEPVEALVVGYNRGGLSVDFGLRGFVPMSQIDLHRVENPGSYLGMRELFRVTEFDKKKGNIVLSRRSLLEDGREERRAEMLENLQPGQVFQGVVRNLTKFGAFVDIGGVEGLLHRENMTWGNESPSDLFQPGDRVEVIVLDYDPERNRLGLGRKQLQDDPWKDAASAFSEGDVVTGTVTSIVDFGAFVRVAEGLEGLIHVTELSWTQRVANPGDVVAVGQEVEVKITNIDLLKRRMGLSIKQLQPNPWETFAQSCKLGDRVSGKVVNIVDFGVFVEVAPGIDGLIHVSDMSWTERIDKPGDRFELGHEVEAVVIDLDVEQGRLGLGLKQLTSDPWQLAAEIAVPGKKIDVTIARLADFGAFATIVDGVEGLIHISELREERVHRVGEVVKVGQTVSALVTTFDRDNQRIGLSLKRDELGDVGGDMKTYSDEGGAATLGDLLKSRLGLSDSTENS
ncbi:MAG: 30S ribosomal protein S1 [bacterium]